MPRKWDSYDANLRLLLSISSPYAPPSPYSSGGAVALMSSVVIGAFVVGVYSLEEVPQE
jgi:hypothetical protein